MWSPSGRLMCPPLGISESLWRDLLDWQAEAYNEHWTEADRSEDEWDQERNRLAIRLAAETGRPIEYVP